MGHSLHLFPPQNLPAKTARQLSEEIFTERVVKAWNQLPEEVVLASSLSTFKSRLDKFWNDERNLPPCACEKPSLFCIPQPVF